MENNLRFDVIGSHRADSREDTALLLSFKDDYGATFPLDEAEYWYAIVGRCLGHTFLAENVDTYIAVLKDGDVPVGATVGEHYKGSGVLLVTYCVVRRALRRAGKGYGQRLMLDGSAEICRCAGIPEEGRCILFEGEDPDLMPSALILSSPFDPRSRLKWFISLGALKLPFRYVQPPLSPGGAEVRHLSLYTIGEKEPPKETVAAFLWEFYGAHEKNVPEAGLERYRATLDVQLQEINSIWNICFNRHADHQ